MCGIAGIINLNGENTLQGIHLKKMSDQMNKRGPDDEGLILFNSKSQNEHIFFGDNTPLNVIENKSLKFNPHSHSKTSYSIVSNIGFCHRRLSIVDLSEYGHQPMCDPSGRVWIVFNGEIYNYQELSNELKQLGYQPKGDSDTEILIYCYMEWGAACLEKLNGMFAFAIYDKSSNEIFLARDRVGIKPLYYTIKNNHFVFASEIKTIIASGLYQPEVNEEGLWHCLSFSVAPRPMTAFKNVYALEEAHWMKINLNSQKITKEKYWNIPLGTQNLEMKEDEAIDLVESELKKAIKYRLIADVEVGTFMSGGIDSTTISVIANNFHPGIKAFTLGFEDVPDNDELKEAAETARMNKMSHLVEIVKPEDFHTNINDYVLGFEEPTFTLSPEYILSKLVNRNKIKVVLTGNGGDELFGGYPVFKYLNIWEKIKTLKFVANLIPNGINPKVDMLKNMFLSQTIDEYYTSFYLFMQEYEKKQLFIKEYNFDSTSIFRKTWGSDNKGFADNIEALNYYSLRFYISTHLLYRGDQFTMMNSIEARYPMLDHNFIETAFKIPSKFKIKNNLQKYILRKVAQKYIASSSINMKKKGFSIPVEKWINNELRDLVNSSIENLKKRGLFHEKKIDAICKKYKSRNQKKVWQLVMLELWFHNFN